MITPVCVASQVVDIRRRGIAIPKSLIVDANVLYWIFYPNFVALQSAGGRGPSNYQLQHYPAFWQTAATNGAILCVTPALLGEFARVAEYAEWEAMWLTDSTPPPSSQFDPRTCKLCRYHYGPSVRDGVRQDVAAMLASARKSVQLLPPFPSPTDQHQKSLAEWVTSASDFVDADMVASSKRAGVPAILSDDMDLATCAGITLYTANQKSIDAARAAGKLV